MKIIDIIKFNRELLFRLYSLGIRMQDIKYVDLYTDYMQMSKDKEKKTYIVAALSEKYSVSERKVYDLIKHFNCKVVAE